VDKRLVIRCEGKGGERGFVHGSRAQAQVHDNIETYRLLLRRRVALDWAEAARQAARFVPWIEAWDADLADELRGIAEGAGVDLMDIVLLNARSSFTLTRPAHECTALASLPVPGEAADTVLAQNWDNMRRLKAVVLDVAAPGRPRCVTLTEAGTLAKIGLNSEGIGVCVNGLHAPGAADNAIPIFVLLRRALQSTTLVDAMRTLTATPRDAPHNYLVASAGGAAFDIEACTRDFEVLAPRGRFLIHTNHFVGPRLAARDEHRVGDPGTVLRLWRAETLAAQHHGPFGAAQALELLGDHFNAPSSICAHADATEDGLQGETKCAVVMELGARRMTVTTGHPCAPESETFVCN
jgi:isopenicillin-N N-acyltransferase like protein